MGMDIKMSLEINIDKKYIGSCCGNSFVIFDCRDIELDKKTKANLAKINITKHGVDSALFVGKVNGFDASMEIFEKDGSESDSCGNGLMLIGFLLNLTKGTIKTKKDIVKIEGDSRKQAVLMNMGSSEILNINKAKKYVFVRMGEPHIIYLTSDLKKFDLVKVGTELQKKYPDGVNVDVIQMINESHYLIRTYERGLFAITLSCGTGSLSSYLAVAAISGKTIEKPVEFRSEGGIHSVFLTNDMLKLETYKRFCKIKKCIN